MKVWSVVVLSILLAGCRHEQSPYTAADETNNPPRAQPAFTNAAVPAAVGTNSAAGLTTTTNAVTNAAAPRP